MNLKTYWQEIKSKLSQLIDPNSFALWIEPLKEKSQTNEEVILIVPNMVFYQGILDDYLEKIDHCKALLNLDFLNIRFEIENSLDEAEILSSLMETDGEKSFAMQIPSFDAFLAKEENNLPIEQVFSKGSQDLTTLPLLNDPTPANVNQFPSKITISKSLSGKSNLNVKYTFDSFVKGPSNQFAYATCMNVAENPGKTYNPLFIYGATGLGKTHLMHAVGNRVKQLNPDAVIMYISSEQFMNEMIYCLRFNKMWDFRQKYRHCDVFLVDDIQFISRKKATQEEFFHTFNSLYEAKKQIVFTSDMFPQDIPDIEERLRNRFQWGLIADIQPPDIEHRIAILLNKSDQLGINLSIEVAEFIASHAKKNVRELEGALHRLAAFSALHGRPIDIKLAAEIFQSMLPDSTKRLDIETIQKIVSDFYKIKISDLKGKKRQKTLTLPRQVAMYLSRNLTHSSYPEIGEKFGGKDHTTVMHAVKKVNKDLADDFELKANVEFLERQIEQQI